MTTNNEPSLAGTQCPKCDTICVYQPPQDALAQGITTVDIACHACGHIFETALPETDIDMPIRLDQKTSSGADIEADQKPPTKGKTKKGKAKKDKSEKKAKDKTTRASGGRLKRFGMMLGIAIAATGVVIGIGVVLNPPADDRSFEEQFSNRKYVKPKGQDTSPAEQPQKKATPTPAPKAEPVKEPAPAQQSTPPKPVQKIEVPITPAKFISQQVRFEVTENNLGQVLMVKFALTNTGGSPGLPEDVMIALKDAEGMMLMSWSIDLERRPFAKDETRQYSTQVIEPPEGITAVEINITPSR